MPYPDVGECKYCRLAMWPHTTEPTPESLSGVSKREETSFMFGSIDVFLSGMSPFGEIAF